jgi:hypothetical protein
LLAENAQNSSTAVSISVPVLASCNYTVGLYVLALILFNYQTVAMKFVGGSGLHGATFSARKGIAQYLPLAE